ncbi:S1 family peptidase [Actinokineospora bangkokensis]|uniref:S1 family peptidase n=1 Tax=Actinokineospora bangkokensis TaxID=1193682 RepID=UPI000A06452E
MRTIRVGAALACATAAALTAFTSPAEATDYSPRIIDGGDAGSGPWAARLFSDGRETCSATIIAAKWILTAEHCVAGGGTLTFHIGSLDQTQGEQATGVSVHTHPTADLALVELDHDVQATYAPLGPGSAVSGGQTVQIYGWGATCTDQPEINCQSRTLKVADVTVATTSGSDYRGGRAVTVTYGDGIAAGGDSGGPMFATSPVDGQYYQVGVASTSDRATTSNYTATFEYRDWITQTSGV